MPLLVDLEGVPDEHLDCCLDGLHKALAEDPAGDGSALWDRHANPWAADLVEDVTGRLQRALLQIQEAFSALLLGKPISELAKAEDAPWVRWDQNAFEAARRHLESIPPAQYSLEDWMLAAEYVVHRYLPDGVISSLAEYLTLRATLLGKISACTPLLAPDPLAALKDLLPNDFRKVPPRVLTPTETAILRVSKERAALHIKGVTEAQKSRMKTLICEHVQAQVLGQPQGTAQALRQRLFDGFGQLNRDFRKVAVTEAGECVCQGFISATPAGRQVKRVEAYRGACLFCKGLNNRLFTVVPASKPDRNGQTEVWEGKTNVGRSAAPRRRIDGALVERMESERWWPAAGVQHPNCRGAWLPVLEAPPAMKPDFKKWMDEQLAAARKGQPVKPFRQAAAT